MFLLIIFLVLTSQTIAQTSKNQSELKIKDVIISALENYPLVLEAINNVEAAKMKVMESYGAFDLKLKSKIDQRLDGYYDGSTKEVILEKPLGYLNSKMYSGYRISNGDFPIYEGKSETLDSGEIRLGMEISLWRNRDIDNKRLKLNNSKINQNQKEAKLFSTKIKIQNEAVKAYWSWVSLGKIYYVYEELLNIALNRERNLKQKIKKGDVAKIYEIENQQYIVKRKNQLLTARMEFEQASIYLSLFIRSKDGNPILPHESMLPSQFTVEKKITLETLNQDILQSHKLNPDIIHTELNIQKIENEIQQSENNLIPKVDLTFEYSKDYGDGKSTLVNNDQRALISIEIPLERRLGRGEVAHARAKKIASHYKRELLKQQMEINTRSYFLSINNSVDAITMSSLEFELAKKMQIAEQQKFERGASDFFVVNLREQNTADAQIKNIKAHFNYQKALADYNATCFKL